MANCVYGSVHTHTSQITSAHPSMEYRERKERGGEERAKPEREGSRQREARERRRGKMGNKDRKSIFSLHSSPTHSPDSNKMVSFKAKKKLTQRGREGGWNAIESL